MRKPEVIVIGSGSTGSAIAHDLALRGAAVTVLERGGIASGTTGLNHGQFHSGARYAVNDPEAAAECIAENRILRKIMPGVLELFDGLFLATEEAHLDFRPRFLEGCARAGIPAQELTPAEALRLEPGLNPRLLAAVRIPDGSFDPVEFCMSFLATAGSNGARLLTCVEVTGLEPQRGAVQVYDRLQRRQQTLHADLIVNAAGPWASRVAALAGVQVQVEPSAGVIAVQARRACNMVLNLLAPPANGDIIVPLRNTIMLGTTSWHVDDPDHIPVPDEHVAELIEVAAQMLPEVRRLPLLRAFASARPLLVLPGQSGRAATRGFAILDHAAAGLDGLVTILGGKTITARLMAEKLSDLACAKLGLSAECRTAQTPLVSIEKGLPFE